MAARKRKVFSINTSSKRTSNLIIRISKKGSLTQMETQMETGYDQQGNYQFKGYDYIETAFN